MIHRFRSAVFIGLSLLLTISGSGLLALGQSTDIPDYANAPRSAVPSEYTWKVDDIFPNLDAWQAAKKQFVLDMEQIDTLKTDWTSSAEKMLNFLNLTDSLGQKARKLSAYIGFLSDTDMGDTQYQKLSGELQGIMISFSQKLSFVNSDILDLGAEGFKAFLAQEPKLSPHKIGVEELLRMKQHVLPTDQQKIVSLSSMFSAVPSRAAGMLNNMEIPSATVNLKDGTEVILNTAGYNRHRGSAVREDRRKVMNEFWLSRKKFEKTFAILFDGAMKQHLFTSKVRSYANTLEAQLHPNGVDPQVYHQLIRSVHENLDTLHRFLKLKKTLLAVEDYRYDDIYASSVQAVNKRFGAAEAETLIKRAMKPLGQEYAAELERAFRGRWMDLYPNQGKSGGAYSSGVYGVHPFIKLNYNGDYGSVSTMAHELGHALHTVFSNKKQPYPMASYPIFLAEIASTFNENLLVSDVMKHEKDDLFKLYILDSYLDQVRSTIFRQTLFAEFELAMHQKVEAGESLTADWLNSTFLNLTRLYYGHEKNICQVDEFIQSEWMGIPHFFYNYYVYQYSTGMIASMALADMVLSKGKKGAETYLAFLSAGGSDFPLETLKKAGVDMTSPLPAQAAFRRMNALMDDMEKLIKKTNQKK